MPECCEVEKLRKQLSPHWIGRVLTNIRAPLDSPNPTKYVQGSWTDFRAKTRKQRITGIDRHGKHLWLRLEDGAWQVYLGSTGWFYPASVDPKGAETFLHAPGKPRLILTFDDGQRWHYHDARTWGVWYLREGTVLEQDPYFKEYGPDWLLKPGHAADALLKAKSKRTVKEVLCDQHITAGLGNYLSVEICAIAGVHPHQPYSDLSVQARRVLLNAVAKMLIASAKASGHEHWSVFNKAGVPCSACGTPIEYVKDKGGSRGSYFCGSCQPMRK